MSRHQNKEKGSFGEKLAVQFLKKKGYKILEKNFTTDIGEIDIIAVDGSQVVFVEVKTRLDDRMGLPAEAVEYRKQSKISKVASQYIKKHQLYSISSRFDVVDIQLSDNKITHYEDAFDSYIKY